MLDETNDPRTEATTPSDEPEFVRFVGSITNIADPDEAARMADVLLLLLAAAGTVLGCILGSALFLYLFAPHPYTFGWIWALLASAGLGGFAGCAVIMIALHIKNMIVWERRRND